MKLEHVTLEETECFSPIFLDYINQKESLKSFYDFFPKLENFQQAIGRKKMSAETRARLEEVLAEQYGPLETSEAVEYNIHSLAEEKTFTVTTGHQLNIFTGPLYFIYKIVSVINACKALKKAYPSYHFVPVYWMASEDHDFDEISYFHLFGKKYTWDKQQDGAVGRLKPHSLNSVIEELPEPVPVFEKAYLDNDSLANAVRDYVNELFGKYGLVVLDADHPKLKGSFTHVIEQELFDNPSNELVKKATDALQNEGYKDQAFSRKINLFYLDNGLRERIEHSGDHFKIVNTDLTFSESEMRQMVEDHPERFSPNVILRPLFQETILLNLAYVGGPSEIAYWLQLKGVFDHFEVPLPALMPRNFGLVINKANQKKVEKLGLSAKDLFKSAEDLKEAYLQQHGDSDFDLQTERKEINATFASIQKKAEEIDGSLVGFIGAEESKAQKSLENIAKRLKKSEENKNEIAMNQIDTIKEKLFPNGNLQERHDNFLNFYLNNPQFIDELIELFDAFDFRFHVLHMK